jgi:hypothetical protein
MHPPVGALARRPGAALCLMHGPMLHASCPSPRRHSSIPSLAASTLAFACCGCGPCDRHSCHALRPWRSPCADILTRVLAVASRRRSSWRRSPWRASSEPASMPRRFPCAAFPCMHPWEPIQAPAVLALPSLAHIRVPIRPWRLPCPHPLPASLHASKHWHSLRRHSLCRYPWRTCLPTCLSPARIAIPVRPPCLLIQARALPCADIPATSLYQHPVPTSRADTPGSSLGRATLPALPALPMAGSIHAPAISPAIHRNRHHSCPAAHRPCLNQTNEAHPCASPTRIAPERPWQTHRQAKS